MKNATPQIDLLLGRLKGTYRVKISVWYFTPHLVLLLVATLGFGIFWGADYGWKQYISFGVFLLFTAPFVFAVGMTLPKIFDRLLIYENGFKYGHGRQTSVCLWNEVADINSMIDTDGREKLSSIVKKTGEKIAFAYKMRGLDILSHEYDLFQNSGYKEAGIVDEPINRNLGAIVRIYHVRHGLGVFLPLGAALFVFAFGSITLVATPDILGKVLCTGIPGIVLLILLWNTISDWSDEMILHENGFSYANRKGIINCSWDEIVDYSMTTKGSTLTGVKKDDGTWISFANEMQGLDMIKPHVRTLLRDPEA